MLKKHAYYNIYNIICTLFIANRDILIGVEINTREHENLA